MQEKSGIPDPDADMAIQPEPALRLDRLSALMARFHLRIAPGGQGRLAIRPGGTGRGDGLGEARFWPRGQGACADLDGALEIGVDWGGEENPLLAALPDCIALNGAEDAGTGALIGLLLAEAEAARCGAEGAVARLAEVLLIRLLRREIARGAATPGLVGGLACPRIARALVAIHAEPGRPWTNATLAETAGLSRSRFAELFALRVGETPQAYLRRWRLTLAHQALAGGARVGRVAHGLGYASAEALARAFRTRYGIAPREAAMHGRSADGRP